MEVHHHSHHETSGEKKKWTHYFWEFFMLFLAVTLGFFVENQREHFVEHKREIQYIHSYIEDMHSDITQIDSMMARCQQRINMCDSLTIILNEAQPSARGAALYYYARLLTLNFPFFSNDRTIQQLKNGGNLRLIKKQAVSDAMMDYDRNVRFLQNIAQREEDYVREYVRWLEQVCDPRVFNEMSTNGFGFKKVSGNPQLIKNDQATILEFMAKLHFLRSANSFFGLNYQKARATAQHTLDIIDSEYHIR